MATLSSYASPEKVRAQIDKTLTIDDVDMERLSQAASDLIDRYCYRPYGFKALTTATARQFAGKGEPYLYIGDCVEVTLVEVKDGPLDSSYTAWASTDWIAYAGASRDPEFNPLDQRSPEPYTHIMVDPSGDYSVFTSGSYSTLRGFRPERIRRRAVQTVQVTAKWGYAVKVPAVITQAATIQVARWLKRAKSGWADAVASSDFEQLVFAKSLDVDVQLLIGKAGMRRLGVK